MNDNSRPTFLDTNVLIYLYDTRDGHKHQLANEIVKPLITQNKLVISNQVLQEFCNVYLSKLNLPHDDLISVINSFLGKLVAHVPSIQFYEAAIELQHRYNLSFYDALVIQAATDLRCTTFLSEDMQHGQKIGELTIVNPFRI